MTVPPPVTRHDPSMCPHLKQYLLLDDTSAVQIKLEDGILRDDGDGRGSEQAATRKRRMEDVTRRFVEIVKWAAVAEGVKRRKVSPSVFRRKLALSILVCPLMPDVHRLPLQHVLDVRQRLSGHVFASRARSSVAAPMSVSSSNSKDCMREHWNARNGTCGFGELFRMPGAMKLTRTQLLILQLERYSVHFVTMQPIRTRLTRSSTLRGGRRRRSMTILARLLCRIGRGGLGAVSHRII